MEVDKIPAKNARTGLLHQPIFHQGLFDRQARVHALVRAQRAISSYYNIRRGAQIIN